MRSASVVAAMFILAAAFDPAHAQPQVFERCVACHSSNGSGKDVGPSLVGVFGRKAR